MGPKVRRTELLMLDEVAGGYLIVRPVRRPSPQLPAEVLSASECVCPRCPPAAALAWGRGVGWWFYFSDANDFSYCASEGSTWVWGKEDPGLVLAGPRVGFHNWVRVATVCPCAS